MDRKRQEPTSKMSLGKRKERSSGDIGGHGSTLFVSNLPYSATSVDLQTLFSDLGPVHHAFVVLEPGSGTSKGVGYVSFSVKEDAEAAINHVASKGMTYHGRKLRVYWAESKAQQRLKDKTPKKRRTSVISPSVPSRGNRLIVRNLPWDITEKDLRALFSPFGPIHSIDMPTSETDSARNRGFAFVWMSKKGDAGKAIAGCNGKTVRAGSVTSKVDNKKERQSESHLSPRSENDDDGSDVAAMESSGRVIAVDWALSKERWNMEKEKMEELGKLNAESEHDSQGEDDEEQDEERNLVSSDEDPGETSDEGDGESGETSTSEHKPSARPPPPPEGTTLFIRNIPYEAMEQELHVLFQKFGHLRYARITLDQETGQSRGTGFVCFWNKADADKAVECSELLRTETMGHEVPTKKDSNPQPSILTPDPSSMLARSLVLHGRTLDVVRAVTRDDAIRLKEEGGKKREKSDKRNLYLLQEGAISPNSPDAKTLTPVELEKRTNSFNARRALLRSNPILYVSKTRLSIRQIPLFVTERMLKRLATHAIHAFEREVKEGLRPALTEEELLDVADVHDVTEEPKSDKTKRKKRFETKSKVQQAKIVRQQERVDSLTGKARSRGYGFVEMYKHADALRVLRWANNNANLGPLLERWWKEELEHLLKLEKAKKPDDARVKRIGEELQTDGTGKIRTRLIVEFSIENLQVVRRRSAKQSEKPLRQNVKKLPLQTEPVGPPPKKRRTSKDVEPKKTTKDEPVKQGQQVGSLIGRKRKQRKLRHV